MRPSIENVLEHQSCSDGLKLEEVIKESSVKHIGRMIYSTVLTIVCKKNVISHKHFTCLHVLDSDWVSQ